jgi:hypothetical protein
MLAGTPDMRKYRGIPDVSRPAPARAARLTSGYPEMNAEYSGPEKLRPFTRISSPLYRQLEGHFEHVFAAWAAETRADRDAAAALPKGGAS